MREKSKLFLINGTILTLTALFMRFVTLIFNIYISNKIGSEAVGIFSLVMAVYLFFITVATSGLNIAVTCIVSEKFALENKKTGIKVRGHEFHYYDSTDHGSSWEAVKPLSSRHWDCMHSIGNLLAGFPHLYYASNIEFVAGWVGRCRQWKENGLQ